MAPRLSLWAAVFSLCQTVICASECSAPTETATSFSQHAFDYLIVGAGAGGLTVAARLSENPSIQVGVIEAGELHSNDPLIDIPGNSGIGNATYDWLLSTVPQTNANGREIAIPRGKMIGGSTGLNFMAWQRAAQREYDVWENFAPGAGWNWRGLLPYFAKSATFDKDITDPYPGISKQEEAVAEEELSRLVGSNGPIQASWNTIYTDIVTPVVETLNRLGIPTKANAAGGNITGVQNTLLSIDRKHGTRSYAKTGYYCPNSHRSNLHVLTGAQVTKILFAHGNDTQLTATGAEYSVGGQSYQAKAKKEVIISGGPLKTPQILELSGIGNSTLLTQLGINTTIDLPGVGENHQEHLFAAAQFQLLPGHHTFDELRNNATFAAEQTAIYQATGGGLFAAIDSTITFIPMGTFLNQTRQSSLLQMFDSVAHQASPDKLSKLQYPIQRSWIETNSVPHIEIIAEGQGLVAPAANQSYVSLLIGLQHPTSRGTVHINTTDPLAPPVVDPHFLNDDFDTNSILEAMKFGQSIMKVSPVADNLVNFTAASDAELLDNIRSGCSPGGHSIGTASMGPRENGGVVDSQLKVYGTKNLRVVDASIIPLHVAAHIQSTVYAIAEKAADMIRGKHQV